jgi:signal transduction histidine kinase
MMSPSLMPHAVCWRLDPPLIWTMVATNSVTFLSYSTICIALIYLARRTHRVIARDWAYFLVGFALFIVACGSTHLMDVITTWIPVFWIDAWTSIITAALSAYVAIQFVRRTKTIGFAVNDYAERLSNTEHEKARIQESLLSARRMEEWNRMSSVVTHEISNPLDAIQNLLYLIHESPGISPEVATMAEQSAEEVRRVIGLTRSTLGFFRQGSHPEPVDLRTSVESVRFLLDPILRQKGIELVILATGNCTVNAYSVETRQVLLNLVRNACEATTRRGARIRVTMEGRPNAVHLVVQDQAGGIDPAMLANLFQFGASTKGEDGNGMGLWVVQQLVRRHGGTITVDSKPGEGTRFTISWPREFSATKDNPESIVATATT